MEHFDFVIVGGGTAGCVLAARLSEQPGTRVLLVESGSDALPRGALHPPAWPTLVASDANWGERTVTQSATGTSAGLPRGRGLGGSSAINAMLFARGHRSSYDVWPRTGLIGWGFEDLLPFFMRSERTSTPLPGRGSEGPLIVSPASPPNEVLAACLQAAIQAGHPRAFDISSGLEEGFGPVDLNIVDGRRQSAADAYLRPAMNRPNLTVVTEATAHRLRFDGRRCVGVDYARDGNMRRVVWRFLADPTTLQAHVAEEAEALRQQYRFFHWPLEFPEVFKRGGFSLVLGNPPWETMSPDAKEFFAKHEPDIAGMTPAQQQTRIAELLAILPIRVEWERHARELYAAVRFVKESGRYRMFAAGNLGKGDFNVYRQFAELAMTFAAPDGVAAQVVPENFYNGANASAIRAALLRDFRLSILFGFENARGVWFPGVDTRMKFALYVAWRGYATTLFAAAFAISSEARLQAARERPMQLPVALVSEFSPDALAVMEFSNQFEIDLARKIYARFPRLGDMCIGLPNWDPVREVDMGTNNDLFTNDSRGWPLYQGSMVTHHDYRAKGYLSGHGRNVTWEPLAFDSTTKSIRPQWRVLQDQIPKRILERVTRYRIGFCDVARADDQRSLMAALIPPRTVCGDKVPTIEFEPADPAVMILWLGVANSLALDFIVRMKVSLKMSMSLMATLPFPRRVTTDDSTARVCALAARLSCAGTEMADFLRTLEREPTLVALNLSPANDPDERARLAAELDVVVARDLFGLSRDEMQYLLEPRDVLGPDCTAETFAALRRAEEREFGEYRTKRLVLEVWDLTS